VPAQRPAPRSIGPGRGRARALIARRPRASSMLRPVPRRWLPALLPLCAACGGSPAAPAAPPPTSDDLELEEAYRANQAALRAYPRPTTSTSGTSADGLPRVPEFRVPREGAV